MIDEKDLTWKFQILPLLSYLLAVPLLLLFFWLVPILGIALLLIIAGRLYFIHFLINKQKRMALADYYNSLDEKSKYDGFLQKYDDTASVFVNFLAPFDKLENFRFIILKPTEIEIYELGGLNTKGVKKTYRKDQIDSIFFTDIKIMRTITFRFRSDEGKIEMIHIPSGNMKFFDQFEQLVNSYYGQYIKN